jgi:hypothetical protein
MPRVLYVFAKKAEYNENPNEYRDRVTTQATYNAKKRGLSVVSCSVKEETGSDLVRFVFKTEPL